MKIYIELYFVYLVTLTLITFIYIPGMCLAGEQKLTPKAEDSNETTSGKVYEISGENQGIESSILRMSLYGVPLSRNDTRIKAKKIILEDISKVKGKSIQLLRFFSWIIESDGELRKELMRQWLGQMKYEKQLLPLHEIYKAITPLIANFESVDVKKRLDEIKGVYDSLQGFGDFDRLETEFEHGTINLKELKPFLDGKYPLGSVLFSGDPKAIRAAYKRSRILRGIDTSVFVSGFDLRVTDMALSAIYPKIYEYDDYK
jgi:hypothetical protein